jgi:hypothetical protein
MFGKRPVMKGFRIDNIQVFRSAGGKISALVHGAGFMPENDIHAKKPNVQKLFVNGVNPYYSNVVSPSLIEVSFPAPSDDMVQVTLVYDKDTIRSRPVPNPGHMKISKVTVISFQEAKENEPAILVVRIEGYGFPGQLNPSDLIQNESGRYVIHRGFSNYH